MTASAAESNAAGNASSKTKGLIEGSRRATFHNVNQRSKKAYPGTQAVSRALRLLGAFTDATPTWSLSALAQASSLSKTTTLRLLSALEERGLVARESNSERYRLGPEAIALGARAMRANPLRGVVRPELERLARETGETATLDVLVGLDVLIIDEAAASRLMSAGEVGVLYPAHATGTGKILLAARGGELPARLDARTPRTITDPGALREALDRALADGFAWNVEELERGFAAVGAPVRDGSGRVIAALGLGGPVTRMLDGESAAKEAAVVDAARRASRLLGGGE